VLTKRKCNLTGIVNLYPVRDPLMSVGFVVERPAAAHYDWHFHFDGCRAGGTVANLAAAEAAIREHYRHTVVASDRTSYRAA
jgi:hypothetical protein